MARFWIFRENMKRIGKHNKMAYDGDYSYFLKMNSHGDKSPLEFSTSMNGYRKDFKQVT